MGLSSDLISQFVKATNDKEEVKKESILYGTTVEHEGTTYVKIDGSDLLTPIATTADTLPGERVTVMIKNHTATVTGNLSSPAARSDDIKEIAEAAKKITEFEIIIADKVDTEALNAEKARIDALVADNVTIKQTLVAAEGDIDRLQASTLNVTEKLTAAEGNITKLYTEKLDVTAANAKYATIENLEATNADLYDLESTYAEFVVTTTNKLTANDASIRDLEAKKLSAEQADLKYATIVALNAEKARIDDLEAEVADIDTLIFGSATGSVIHSSFSNAVIAQLGDAQIKSAMIESIAADKITSGDIITNNVRVMSEDGSLIISDETIQIKDEERVRVQIGKDATGDYSINIWDADGKLMFSEGGITDNAIKNAIIRNDMVSDTANIAAHKLDIDSLFEEINGSEKTIKSSRVYLDEQGQKLDVAFKTLTTDVEELQNGVSSQGTQITAIQGQIASKIWKNDIETAVNEVGAETENLSTQYEELQQDVTSMTATVANHTSEIAKKADNTTVTEVNNKVTSLETNLSGFQSTVSSTYATKNELNNASDSIDGLTERISNAETLISNNTESIDLCATKTEMNTAKSEAISTANNNTTNLLKSYSTTEEMKSAIQVESNSIKSSVSSTYATISSLTTTNNNVAAAKQAADNAQAEIDNMDIGCRNLFKGYSDNEIELAAYQDVGSFSQFKNCLTFNPCETVGETYTISFWAKSPNGSTPLSIYNQNGQPRHFYFGRVQLTADLGDEWEYFTHTLENVDMGDTYTDDNCNRLEFYASNQMGVLIKKIKVEKGNVATDWTPAPEDMATSDELANVQSTTTIIEERVTTSESLIEQLTNSISMLVTDGNGESLMTQTSDGWTFSTKEIQDIVDTTSENLDALTNDVGDIDSAVGVLQQAVSDLGVLSEYIKIGTYEDEPCIELGETDSDFKLLITNTRIMFMEGTGVPAYLNNQSLFINKAVIEEELQQGEFVWKVRSNGNLGLIWKGATS